MPVLRDKVKKTERFYLPSTDNLPEPEKAFVDMDVSPMITADIITLNTKGGEVEVGARMLAQRIEGWNFTDEAGNDVPVTFENIKRLDLGDFGFLADKLDTDIEGLPVAEKKT